MQDDPPLRLEVRELATSPRRRFLQWAGAFALSLGAPPFLGRTDGAASSAGRTLSKDDEAFLDDLQRAGGRFFWEAADERTGLVLDRAKADGGDDRTVASVAATGFGLTALCVAAERGHQGTDQVRGRVLATLRFLAKEFPHEHGFFYHFVDARDGRRVWQCELSSIDTAILLCGVLMCGEFFADAEIRRLAQTIFDRVDFAWMLNGGELLSHGWRPESGFLKHRWDAYCELMMLYLLALGSSTHPIPAACWQAWRRPWFEHEGLRYVGSPAPLFVHQFSHAWFDFRHRRDASADYFENSVLATRAHRLFCLRLKARFPEFSEDLWGITASDSAKGYVVWGGPPEMGPLDGTVVPCAAAGSLPFLPTECLRTLRSMRQRFGDRAWKRYGFVDAFNPHTGWTNPDVIGINVGISVLMAENLRTGLVWRRFMRGGVARRGMERAGFRP